MLTLQRTFIAVVAARPAAYWSSNPNLPGDTVTVSGTFTGRESLHLCSAPGELRDGPAVASCRVVVGADIWNSSVKFVLPQASPQPVWLRVGSEKDGTIALPINAPDVWWWVAIRNDGVPLKPPQAPEGSRLRVLGRGLAWNDRGCVSAQERAASSTTMLHLSARGGETVYVLPADVTTCFEASFVLSNVPQGEYSCWIATPWGESAPWSLVIGPTREPSTPVDIAVDDDFDGNVSAALQHAATLIGARVMLGPRLYHINTTLIVGNHTQMSGYGKDKTILRFALGGSDATTRTCGSHVYRSIDLHATGSDAWSDVGNINNMSMAECCTACTLNPHCNAYSMILPNQVCQLKACQLNSESSCVAQNTTSSAHNSGFLFPFRPLPGFQPVKPDEQYPDGTAAIYANGKGWILSDFALEIASAPACVQKSCGAGIHSQGGSDFVISNLSVALNQKNATSALILNNTQRFTVVNTTMMQNNMCFWGCQPEDNAICIEFGATCGNGITNSTNCSMHSSNSDFKDSALLQMHAASWGHIYRNTLLWKCSAYDIDVSSNLIIEDNDIQCTNGGVLPHGNSASFFDWQNVPHS